MIKSQNILLLDHWTTVFVNPGGVSAWCCCWQEIHHPPRRLISSFITQQNITQYTL